MIKFALFAALLATPQIAAAQTQPCLTRQELSNVFMLAAPALIEAAAKKCATTLPASAFLRTGGKQLAERLRREGGVDAGALTATFAKFSGKEMPRGISAETLNSLVRDVVAAEFANDIKPQDCGKIDDITGALAPLPARNLGTLMTALVELGTGGKQAGPFRVCPAPSQP